MINEKQLYSYFLCFFIFLSLLNCVMNSKEKSSSYKYDYYNILDKGPKTDLTYIFNDDIKENKKTNNEQYSKIVDETFSSFQSLFFNDLETITPLYDQSIKCLFPVKKDISFNKDLYINPIFKDKPKIKIIPLNLAKILLKPLASICYNYFIDTWYYKLCPFNKAVQTLSFLKKNKKTGKEEKEVNYLGYASNETTEFNEIDYFYSVSPYKKEMFNGDIYKFFEKSQVIGTYKNVIKIFDSLDKQNEFKKISDENKTKEILQDNLIYKYQYKKLEIDYNIQQLEKVENIQKYKVNNHYSNLNEFKRVNKSKIVTFEREIRKAVNKNLFLLDDGLPPVTPVGIVNTRIKLFSYNQEDYYNKEFFVEKNMLYCEHCNLLKCQSNNCFLSLSKNKENFYKIVDFIDEKLVIIDSNIDDNISHASKFALYINNDYIFFFGKGKVKEIRRTNEVKFNEKGEEQVSSKFILNGYNLNLKKGDNILIIFKQVNKGEYVIIKDIHNGKINLLAEINKKINETHYEIDVKNINNSSYAKSSVIPVGGVYFKIEKRADFKEKKKDVEIINKSKDIQYKTNIEKSKFNINQLSQITMSHNNLNVDIPYELFNLNTKNNQSVFHFVLKKTSTWKESYINLCLSANETCTENDFEIIIHSKKGILIHKPSLSAKKVVNDSLLFHSNNIMNLFTEKIICDIILVNSSLYFNVIDFSEYSSIRLKYIFKNEDFDKIKYVIISPTKSNNIKIKGIYVTNIISMKLIMNMYFYDEKYLLDDKAIFMETFTNGDYCDAVKKPRSVKVFYMCDETGVNNLKISKVHEAKNKLCEYIYYVKSRLLCNPTNIIKNQFNSSFSKSLCYSDKTNE